MKKLLLTGLLILGISASALQAAEYEINTTIFNRTTDISAWYHRGVIAGESKVKSFGKTKGKKFFTRVTCAAVHELKCDFSVDRFDIETKVLELSFYKGVLYDSVKAPAPLIWRKERWGKIALWEDGELKGRKGHWTINAGVADSGTGRAFYKEFDIHIRLDNTQEYNKIEFWTGPGLDATIKTKTSINHVTSKDDLYRDENGVWVGDKANLLFTEDGKEILQTIKCMPSKRFGQWCSTSISELTYDEYGKRIKYNIRFGRYEGDRIRRDEAGSFVIPWRAYDKDGRQSDRPVEGYKKYRTTSHIRTHLGKDGQVETLYRKPGELTSSHYLSNGEHIITTEKQ